jgi:hypothetical protein
VEAVQVACAPPSKSITPLHCASTPVSAKTARASNPDGIPKTSRIRNSG